MRHRDDLGLDEYLAAIATARVVLGPSVRLQAPPNLVDLAECRALLDAGVDDFGGISPLTPDHVNPERPWPQVEELAALCREAGFDLVERLTAHPPYLSEPWLDPRLLPHVAALRGADGLARAGRGAAGAAVAGARRGLAGRGTHRPAHVDRQHRPQHRPAVGLRGRLRQLGRCCASRSSVTVAPPPHPWTATCAPLSRPRSGTLGACPTRTRSP